MKFKYLLLSDDDSMFEEFKTLDSAKAYGKRLIDALSSKPKDLRIVKIESQYKLGIDK